MTGSAVAATMRVVSYNVRSLRHGLDAVAAVVREAQPDVLVLQEAPRHLRWRHRSAALARSTGMVVAAGGSPAVGNLILTRLRVRVRRAWWERFPLTPGRHLRGVALARCEVAGTELVVAGSHLSTDPVERPRQAELLTEVLAAAGAPVVLGVDVNDEPDGAAFQTLTAALADPAAGSSLAGPTYPAAAPGRRIDAVLVDRALSATGCQVHDSSLARRASDHLPVSVDLALAG